MDKAQKNLSKEKKIGKTTEEAYFGGGTLVKDAVKKIDKAAANNLIHKNCAARKKSNLAKKVNA